jgi:branched-chain amino acid transport system substrate-binding protein
MNDQSGPYCAGDGPIGVICAKQALEDFGISGKDWAVEVLPADHLNKPDIGVPIARQWFDRDGAIVDVPILGGPGGVHGVGRRTRST